MNIPGVTVVMTNETPGRIREYDVKVGGTVVGGLRENALGFSVRVWASTVELNERRFPDKASAVEAILAHIATLAFTTDHVVVQVSPKRFVVAEANDRERKKFKVRTKPIPTLAQAEEVRREIDDKEPQGWSAFTNSVYIEETSEL